jgi:peroxiredoxin
MIMKKNIVLSLLAAASLVFPGPSVFAQEKPATGNDLRELVTKIQTKLRDNKKAEADFADELKEFDALLAKHKGEKTDEAAQILLMKAALYKQVFKNEEKADALFAELKREFPDSKPVKMLKAQEESEKLQASLKDGAKFPDFEEKDLAGKPLSIANYKGKVVLVDFWATWCGPCVKELPNVQKAYEKHHAKGFEIIGISLDQDKDKLTKFIADKKMPWQQYFDGEGWGNKLAVKYGIHSIPATYLLDGEGKIIGKNLRGEELEAAVAKALPGK